VVVRRRIGILLLNRIGFTLQCFFDGIFNSHWTGRTTIWQERYVLNLIFSVHCLPYIVNYFMRIVNYYPFSIEIKKRVLISIEIEIGENYCSVKYRLILI